MKYIGNSLDSWRGVVVENCGDQRAAQELQEFGNLKSFLDFCKLIEGVHGGLQLAYYGGERDDGSKEYVITAYDHPEFYHWVRVVGSSGGPGYSRRSTIEEAGLGRIHPGQELGKTE
jgi:hypothetical protein